MRIRKAEPNANGGRPERAVATIWLVFYVLAVAAAIASPFLQDATLVATRSSEMRR